MRRTLLLLATLLWSVALADWTPQGREVSRSSSSRSDISVSFSLLPGEDPVHAALDCLNATRQAYLGVTLADCMAYTPAGYAALSGRIRPCYSVIVRWFQDEDGMLRLYLARDDSRYPKSCPTPAS